MWPYNRTCVLHLYTIMVYKEVLLQDPCLTFVKYNGMLCSLITRLMINIVKYDGMLCGLITGLMLNICAV